MITHSTITTITPRTIHLVVDIGGLRWEGRGRRGTAPPLRDGGNLAHVPVTAIPPADENVRLMCRARTRSGSSRPVAIYASAGGCQLWHSARTISGAAKSGASRSPAYEFCSTGKGSCGMPQLT